MFFLVVNGQITDKNTNHAYLQIQKRSGHSPLLSMSHHMFKICKELVMPLSRPAMLHLS